MYNCIQNLNWEIYRDILRELRNEHEFSQSQVAQILNTTQQVYSRYETGENEIPVRHIIALSQLYNVSTDYILGLTANSTPYPRRCR